MVVVAAVPVAFRKVRFCKVEELVKAKVEPEIIPRRELVESRLVTAKLVVVAEVPVAFRKVKFCRVEEPESDRLAAETVPVAVTLATFTMLPEK